MAVLGWVEWGGCGMETGGVTWWFSGGIKVAVLGWVDWGGCEMETGGVTWWFPCGIKVAALGWVEWGGFGVETGGVTWWRWSCAEWGWTGPGSVGWSSFWLGGGGERWGGAVKQVYV